MLTVPSFVSGELVRWRGSQGDARLSVVCRASYRLEADQVRRLEEPGNAGGVQAPFKAATDVVVVGRGWGRPPVGSPDGRLEVGELEKRLVVMDGKLAGSGPLGPDSPERRRWLGLHAASWREEMLVEHGFPAEADWRYWNVAPPDQQLSGQLAADERIVLEIPGQPALVTRLAGERALGYVAPRATAKASDAEPIEMLADTLWIDLDQGICTVSWRGQVAASEAGVVFVTLMAGDADFDTVRRRARAESVEELTTEDIVAVVPDEALPFTASVAGRRRPVTSTGIAERTRTETGTLGPAELEAAMGNLTPAQREAAPWLAPAPTTPPLHAPTSAWSPPPAPNRGSAPPPGPVPGLGAPPPARAPTEPPAVLSPSMFAATAAVVQTSAPVPVVESLAASPEPSRSKASAGPSEHTQLLWHERASLERVRAHFEELVDELDFVEPDPKRDLTTEDPAEAKDHHHCLGILSRGRPGGTRALQEDFAEAGRDGSFVAPIALVEGELRPSFDEVKKLELTVALLTPLARGDERLRTELDEVSKLFENPVGLRVGGTAERIGRELEALFASKHRAAVDGLDGKVERLLLEDRAFAKRSVFGIPHVRASLRCRDDDGPVVVYLPQEAADALPLFASFPARLLVEVHPQQDGLESHPIALLALAVGRVVKPGLPRYGSSTRR